MFRANSRAWIRLAIGLHLVLVSGVVHAAEAVWTGVERIVAVGDVHGDIEQLEKTLILAGVLDTQGNWSGGKTHLVQVGDALDRGPDSRKVMDLLMKLEKQAPKTGGRVHALIGNHEAMVMHHDLRYVHPNDYASFGGKDSYLQAMSPRGNYGKWIASHNTIVKINGVLFMHGGLNLNYATRPIELINEAVRKELGRADRSSAVVTTDPNGPLWYRGLAELPEEEVKTLLETIFQAQKAKRIVVGHTISKKGIQQRVEGRVIMIDVGMSRYYGGSAACLLIEEGNFFSVYPGSKTELEPASVTPSMDVLGF